MHTKDMLAHALSEVGLHDMAASAATGYYHDFLSPLDLPELTLVSDLYSAAEDPKNASNQKAIMNLRERVKYGEFDASIEESEAWAASPEGQKAFRLLVEK